MVHQCRFTKAYWCESCNASSNWNYQDNYHGLVQDCANSSALAVEHSLALNHWFQFLVKQGSIHIMASGLRITPYSGNRWAEPQPHPYPHPNMVCNNVWCPIFYNQFCMDPICPNGNLTPWDPFRKYRLTVIPVQIRTWIHMLSQVYQLHIHSQTLTAAPSKFGNG